MFSAEHLGLWDEALWPMEEPVCWKRPLLTNNLWTVILLIRLS